MRLLLTSLVFLAGLAAAVLVHAPRAHAAWERPQQIDTGSDPRIRLSADGRPFIAYGKGDQLDLSRIVVSEGNEPTRRVKVPRAGRLVAFDLDGAGKLVALREFKRGKRRIGVLEGRRWRTLPAATSAVDAKLAVAGSGAAVAAWLQYEHSHVVVHAALKRPGAARFGAPQRLSGLTGRAGQTLTVAVDDAGETLVTWAEAGDLMMARTAGGSFATPVRVHDRTSTVAGAFTAAAAIRGESALIAFTRLEDREPPQYRLSAAVASGDTAPVVETVATDVSALDTAAAFAADGTPVVLAEPIGEPYSLRLFGRTGSWAERAAIPTTDAASMMRPHDGGACVTWTVGLRGFASAGGQTVSAGRAYDADCAVGADGSAVAIWDRGPGRPMRVATFTP